MTNRYNADTVYQTFVAVSAGTVVSLPERTGPGRRLETESLDCPGIRQRRDHGFKKRAVRNVAAL